MSNGSSMLGVAEITTAARKGIQEKRRLQNRESQRTYREKHKVIKATLRQASSIRKGLNHPRRIRSLRPLEAAPAPGQAYRLEQAQDVSKGPPEIADGTRESEVAQSLGAELPSWSSFTDLDIDFMDELALANQSLDIPWVTSQLDNSSVSTVPIPPVSHLPSLDGTFYDSSNTYVYAGSLFPAPSTSTLVNMPSYEENNSLNEQLDVSHSGTLALLQVADTKEHRDLLANAIQQRHSIGSIFLAGLQSFSSAVPTVYRTPDIHTNRLSLRHLSTMQAYISNAHALFFNVPSLMHPLAPSPFHQPHITTVAAANLYISTLPETFPLHLRPTPAQILHAHLPFLDLLPFPTLRERAITLASITPPLIDLKELKADIINNGLVCWGGTKRGGQPWDMRTWEATRPFLRKWWILVGGETDEVREGSRWWRRLRGEEEVATRFTEDN